MSVNHEVERLACICSCHDAGHQLVFEKHLWPACKTWDADADIEVYVTLNQIHGFWKRLWHATRYVFRRDQRMAFDSMSFQEEDIVRLRDFLDKAIAFKQQNMPRVGDAAS